MFSRPCWLTGAEADFYIGEENGEPEDICRLRASADRQATIPKIDKPDQNFSHRLRVDLFSQFLCGGGKN